MREAYYWKGVYSGSLILVRLYLPPIEKLGSGFRASDCPASFGTFFVAWMLADRIDVCLEGPPLGLTTLQPTSSDSEHLPQVASQMLTVLQITFPSDEPKTLCHAQPRLERQDGEHHLHTCCKSRLLCLEALHSSTPPSTAHKTGQLRVSPCPRRPNIQPSSHPSSTRRAEI